jgi:hypothetical protein
VTNKVTPFFISQARHLFTYTYRKRIARIEPRRLLWLEMLSQGFALLALPGFAHSRIHHGSANNFALRRSKKGLPYKE